MRLFALAAALVAGLVTNALAIEGKYRVEGTLPGEGGRYQGEAAVRRTGETYTIVWRINDDRHVGTGIVTGPVLSVIFRSLNARGAPGIASFAIVDDRITKGTWSTLGGEVVGTETWSAAGDPL